MIKVFFGNNVDGYNLLASYETEQEANKGMIDYLRILDPKNEYYYGSYWRGWIDPDTGAEMRDFGSWSNFFKIVK